MSYINKIILPSGDQYDIQVKSENIDGIIPVQKGGTGVNSIEEAKQIFNLDAGDITFDDEETYFEGTVGDELSSIKANINHKLDSPNTAGTSGQVLTSDGQGGQTWATTQVDSALSTTSENPVQNKVIKQALDNLDVTDELSHKVAKPSTNPNGTSGQLLRTNGDGTTTWVNEGLPTDAQTAQAVSDWLDSHPEATTTVQDGAITWAKLNSAVQNDINGKAPGIIDEDEEGYNHNITETPLYIDIIGNDHTVGNIKLINALNLLPKTNKTNNREDFTFEVIDYSGTINGTVGNNSGITTYNGVACEIPSGEYQFLLYYDITGATISAYNKLNIKFYVFYEGESSGTQVLNDYPQNIGKYYISTAISLTKNVTKVSMSIQLANSSVYSNAHFWYGLFPATATVVDIGQTAQSGQTIRYSNVLSFSNAICSMQNKSVLTSIVDTKTYIDEKEVDIDEELTYITPERFGAVGDYSTDDLTAWNLCIAYAIANNKSIRAYNEYNISDTLVIYGDVLDISVNKLRCTKANVECIRLRGSYNTLRFGTISGTGHGLKVISDGNSQSAENRICGNMIAVSTGDSLVLNGDTNGIYYNIFDVARYYTANGNCIVGNGERLVAENKFYNSRFSCSNGWAIYDCPGRYFGLSFESDVLNAIYMISGGIYTFTGCRHGELTNKLINRISGESPSATGGTLIKYVRGSVLYLSDRYIPYPAIDISEAAPYDELTNDEILATMWGGARIIAPILIGTSYLTKSGWFQVGDQMFLQADKKICVPKYKSVYTITNADFDMRDAQVMANNAKPYPTKMIIGVADCVIHLPTSYCSIGYSEFIVDQSDPTKLCTIYDSRDDTTPIFDGESLGAGVYKLTAYCNVADSIFPGSVVYIGNTTENDVWNIEKIS